MAVVRATAAAPRRTRGGHTETAEHARCRGLVDVALVAVMRDGLLRDPEAATLRWGDGDLAAETAADGSGSKTDQEGEGTFLYLN